MVLSVEPLEVMRYWHFLRPDGWVVSSVTPYINIPDYPETDQLLDQLATFPNCILVDGGHIAKAAGNLRAQNMVAVGAASSRLDFSEGQLLRFVEVLFQRKGEKIVEINQRAFRYGRAAGLFFRGLVDAGMAIPSALRLAQKIAPETYDPATAADWAATVGRDERRLAAVLTTEETIACDQIPARA
jgi:indolepyruvate ferredoxin oxidoreductase beta subunit